MMLDKTANLLLKNLYEKDKMTIQEIEHITGTDEMKSTSPQLQLLSEEGFIFSWENKDVIHDEYDKKYLGYAITIQGRAYIEQQRQQKYQFWVPYLITTVIAASSLVVSLISLIIR